MCKTHALKYTIEWSVMPFKLLLSPFHVGLIKIEKKKASFGKKRLHITDSKPFNERQSVRLE